METRFEITEDHPADDVVVLAPSGQVDLFTAPQFRARLLDAVDRDVRTVIVDLSETEYMDSSALAALVTARTRFAGRGGRIVVAGCSDDLASRFRITGLHTLFSMADSREEALNVASQTDRQS